MEEASDQVAGGGAVLLRGGGGGGAQLPREDVCRKAGGRGLNIFAVRGRNSHQVMGEVFLLTVGFFCLQLSFFAYSPLRPSLRRTSHLVSKKTPTLSNKAKTVSKNAPLVSKKLNFSTVSKRKLHCKQESFQL